MDSDEKPNRPTSRQRRWYNSRVSETASWIILGVLALIFIRQLASFF